jgi:hypothetical protein
MTEMWADKVKIQYVTISIQNDSSIAILPPDWPIQKGNSTQYSLSQAFRGIRCFLSGCTTQGSLLKWSVVVWGDWKHKLSSKKIDKWKWTWWLQVAMPYLCASSRGNSCMLIQEQTVKGVTCDLSRWIVGGMTESISWKTWIVGDVKTK